MNERMPERENGATSGPVRAGSLSPAFVAVLLGAVVGIAAFAVGTAVAALIFYVDRGDALVAALIGGCVLVAGVGAVSGWAVWRAVVDRIDWSRVEAEQRMWRIGGLGRARVRARRSLRGGAG